MKEEQNDIDIIISKSLLDEASSEEKEFLNKWLEQDDRNKAHFEAYKKTFAFSQEEGNNINLDINIDDEWNKFNENIKAKKTKVISLNEGPSSISWWKVAASTLLIMVSGYVIYTSFFQSNVIIHETQASAKIITLPDNSTITLNTNSRLSYADEFNSTERKVKLDGEAFFEVEEDTKRPFIIEANEAEVKVLGTSFNVATNDKLTEVVVATGKVQLTSLDSEKSVKLTKGDKGVLRNRDELNSAKNNDANFDAWKTKIISFEDADLGYVLATINKIYDSKITVQEGLASECNITVTFEEQSFESVLNVLESTLDLTLEKKGNQLIITQTGC